MKKLPCLAIALIALALPAFAEAKAGQIDTDFGNVGGVITLLGDVESESDRPPLWLAWAPGGKIVAAIGNRVLEYRPDGRPKRDFGTNGALRVEAPTDMTLELAGMAVDSQGRIVVVGTARPGNLTASLFVARYLPKGKPDSSFGNDGTLVTDLALPAPPAPPNKALRPLPTITEPVVEATGLTIDPLDRPLLTGGWVSGYRTCYPFIEESQVTSGFAVRLSVDGTIDSGFGGGIVAPNPAREIELAPMTDGNDNLFLAKNSFCPRGSTAPMEMSRMKENGSLRGSFGVDGRIVLPNANEDAVLARDPFGRLLVLGLDENFASPSRQLLRLKPDGSVDRRFGDDGLVSVPWGPSRSSWTLATDSRGRAIVAGSAGQGEEGHWLTVQRRRRDGAFDSSFGKRGKVATQFPDRVDAQQVMVGGSGKILVGATVFNGDRYGIGLVRYLGD